MKKTACLLKLYAILAICMLFGGCSGQKQPPVLRVAIPYSDHVQDINTNYYINWLKERTGLELDITLIRQTRSTEYLDALFSSGTDIDVIMFGGDFTISDEELDGYIEAGDALGKDEPYKYLNYGSAAQTQAGQILWINYGWLKNLGLSVPSTVEELEEVLKKFYRDDPNGNGVRDEIALAGSSEDYSNIPYELILNSFVYNDPYHSRFGVNSEESVLMAVTDEFREGLACCRRFYSEGLLDEGMFSGSMNRLREIVNSPYDLVGAFTADSVSDVIYQSNPEIMARFIHVTPISGPDGVRNALYKESNPVPAALINAHSKRIDEAKLLLDTMMSEEASLIARYGEQGVDWDFSEGSDVSIYGGPSTIVTFNYIWNTSQNKHLSGIGPMKVPDRYLKGVTWNGINSDTEYIDGRAQISCGDYLPAVEKLHAADKELSDYLDEAVREFITGARDIGDDSEWKAFTDRAGAPVK